MITTDPTAFTVVIDTREQRPLPIPATVTIDGITYSTTTVRKKLDAGDYSLLGYEWVSAVERKWSTQELIKNFSDPRNGIRQGKAFKRLDHSCLHPIILIETALSDFTFKTDDGDPSMLFRGLARALRLFPHLSVIFSGSASSTAARRSAAYLVASLLVSFALDTPQKTWYTTRESGTLCPRGKICPLES